MHVRFHDHRCHRGLDLRVGRSPLPPMILVCQIAHGFRGYYQCEK